MIQGVFASVPPQERGDARRGGVRGVSRSDDRARREARRPSADRGGRTTSADAARRQSRKYLSVPSSRVGPGAAMPGLCKHPLSTHFHHLVISADGQKVNLWMNLQSFRLTVVML